MQGNSKGRYIFLMLAGVYLLYLGWQLLSGFISGDATSPIFPIASVLFFVIGILIIVSNVRDIIRVSREEASESTEESEQVEEAIEEEKAEKPTHAAEKSLFDRAGLGAVGNEETTDTETWSDAEENNKPAEHTSSSKAESAVVTDSTSEQ